MKAAPWNLVDVPPPPPPRRLPLGAFTTYRPSYVNSIKASELPQSDALAARSAGCGLTTVADTDERFRCGITTIASARNPAPRHSQVTTQTALSAPSRRQSETPPRFSQLPTQPMDWTLTSAKDDGITGTTPPRHSQENTQLAPPQLTELYTQYRERQEEEMIAGSLAQCQQIGEGQHTATSTDNLPQVIVTESLAQYQQTGECCMAHITDAAQLTHPISCADDVDMTTDPISPRSEYHGIASATATRRSIGGRCRKWAVSTQDPSQSNKRKCSSCTMCRQQFTAGEPRLQQWSNRNAQRAYVHAKCIKGGLRDDHELVAKTAADTEAVDTVIRLRDSKLNAAAAAVVVLLIHDPYDDNSTAAPDEDDRLFDREEALRHDDVIMDFRWFSTVSWSDIKDSRGTTYVQPPSRFRFASQQAQHAILRAIIHHELSSQNSESAWKVLILSSWLLLGRPAENASGANCASFVETRLDLFWSEDWPALWALVRAECDVATLTQTHSKTKAEQTETRIRKVATLARAGEKGRALVAARNDPPVPVTRDIVQESKGLYPVDPDPAVPLNNHIPNIFIFQIAEFIPLTLKRMPRLSEPGPLGMRAEHWYDFGTQAGDANMFSLVIAHIATATIPDAVLQYLRAGQVTPLAKPTGGHRPLLMMSFLRRLALKAIIAAKQSSVIEAAGALQHGVGCKDGANKMIKSIQYFAEADQSRVLVALDLKAAFQNVSRRSMLHSLGQHDPDLATVFSRWYKGSSTHRMHYEGSYAHIQASSGIDQGCPLSPCGFAAARETISRAILAETKSRLDDGAKLWAYLDDWYIWIKSQHITQAIELISTTTRSINLELQPTKIQIWTASCNSPISPALQDKAKSTLKCLGSHLRISGEQ